MAYSLRVPVQILALHPTPVNLCKCTPWEAVDSNTDTWVYAIHIGDPDLVLNPPEATVGFGESKTRVEREFSLSDCLSLSQFLPLLFKQKEKQFCVFPFTMIDQSTTQ